MEITLYKPHKKQLEIHNAISGHGKFFVVSIGRQFGKTIMGENQALKWCLDNNNWRVGWISPTYKQCKKVFKEMVRALGKCPFYSKPPNHSELTFFFLNGSELIFYSAEAYDSIRGETFDAIVGDEVAFWKREAWTEVIKATLLVRGKKALLLSTPKGKDLFYELFNQAHSNNNYHSFFGTSYDNPFIDSKEIDDARLTLPDHIFRQEYLAEFLEDSGTLFTNIKECIRSGNKTSLLFAGIDLGRADDYTVLTIVNDKNEEIYCNRWRHLEWSKIVNNIVEQLNIYKPYTLIETNGAQDAIYEQIRNNISFSKNKLQPFVTTVKSKPVIIENLIVSFENKDIGIIGEDWQIAELQAFTYDYNIKTRKIKYSAPVGLHDDYVMSRAIATNAHKTMKKKGNYNIL